MARKLSALIVCLSLGSFALFAQTDHTFKMFTNASGQFTFYYPEIWQIVENGAGISFRNLSNISAKGETAAAITITVRHGPILTFSNGKLDSVSYRLEENGKTWLVVSSNTEESTKSTVRIQSESNRMGLKYVVNSRQSGSDYIIPLPKNAYIVVSFYYLGLGDIAKPFMDTFLLEPGTYKQLTLISVLSDFQKTIDAYHGDEEDNQDDLGQ